jgi:archaellum component FlaC
MKRTSENIKDPLFRCVEREVNFAANLLRLVRQDLADVQSVCDGSKKQTNDTRDLLNNLSKGIKQLFFLITIRFSRYYTIVMEKISCSTTN